MDTNFWFQALGNVERVWVAGTTWVTAFVEDEDGQAATEYMMVISVIVVAAIFASRPFVDPAGPWLRTMETLSRDIATIFASNTSPLLPGGN